MKEIRDTSIVEPGRGFTRRAFLGAAAAFAPLKGLAAEALHDLAPQGRRMLQLNGYGTCAETPLDLLSDYITPLDLFFVRDHWIPQVPELKDWGLTVDGEVERPLKLSLGELEAMPQTTLTCVLQCAGNGRGFMKPVVPGVQWKFGAVGNARWSGVRVAEVLRRAGVRATARHLHTFGSDAPPGKVPPFHRSVEIEKLLADGLIALRMNGEPLTANHGAPARLVVPGWAGDHWMKWLTRLSPQPDAQKGFYMDVGYRFPNAPGEPGVSFKPEEMHPVTELFVKSNITTAPTTAKAHTPVTIRGFAFSGAPDISKVEISSDEGVSWKSAVLDSEHAPYAWRRWSHTLKPEAPGKLTLLARATDSKGAVQQRQAVWNQSGYLYNAWHSVSIEVTS